MKKTVKQLKRFVAGLLAMVMIAGTVSPAVADAAAATSSTSAISKPQVKGDPVYIKDKNGKATGIKSFAIGPFTYNNLSVDSDITSTPTVQLSTATQKKIVSKYLMPKWSVIAEGIFRDQADQLVTIKGTGMMSKDTSQKNSFDRQFNYEKPGVDQSYRKYDTMIPDLAAALASEKEETKGHQMNDYHHYSGLKSISSLKDARTLMGQELRNASDDNDNSVDDFLGNHYDKTKGEFRLPDLNKDTKGGFASVVTSVYQLANDYDYVSFGLAIYDIDISPIAADGLKYIEAAQDYVNAENPIKAAAEAKVPGVVYAENNDNVTISEITNNTDSKNTHKAGLENSVEEGITDSFEDSFEWGMEQEVGVDINIGTCAVAIARATVHLSNTWHETWGTTKTHEQAKKTTNTKKMETEVEMPAHTYAKITQNTDNISYSESFQQPVIINYKVAIFAMSGDYYNGTCGGIESSRYDKQWLSVLFENTDGAGAYGCVGAGNLYNRAVVNKNVNDYDRSYGNYNSWCDKSAWQKSSNINWDNVDKWIKEDTRSSHTFKDANGKEMDLSALATNLIFCEKASKIDGTSKVMTSKVSDLNPLYDLDSVYVKDRVKSYDLKYGTPLLLKNIALKAYNKYDVEYYGFEPDWGDWVLCDKDGNEKQASQNDPAILKDGQIEAKQGVEQGENDSIYLKWKIKPGTKIVSKANPNGMDISKVKTPVLKIHVINSYMDNPKVNVDGDYSGLYTDRINLNNKLDVHVYDASDKEINVPYYWECRELNGITTNEAGDTSFARAGTYHIRAYVYDNDKARVFSPWKEIRALNQPALNQITFETGELAEDETTLTRTEPAQIYDLDSYVEYLDQYGNEWTGDKPKVSFSLTRETDGAEIDDNYLTVTEPGSYTVRARADGYEIDPVTFRVTRGNWLEEIVIEEPVLSKNELTLEEPGDSIKIPLKELLSYYDSEGNEWTGSKPTVTFSLGEDTNNAKISSGVLLISSSGTFTIDGYARGYDIDPVKITAYENPVLKLTTSDTIMNLEDPEEKVDIELDRLIHAKSQFGDSWKGDIPALKYQLQTESGDAKIEDRDVQVTVEDNDGNTVTTSKSHSFFTCTTPGTYTIHVEPQKASEYPDQISDIRIKVRKIRHLDNMELELKGLKEDELTIGKNEEGNREFPSLQLQNYLTLYDQYGDEIKEGDIVDGCTLEQLKDQVTFTIDSENASTPEAFDLQGGLAEFYKAGTYTIVCELDSSYDQGGRMDVDSVTIKDVRPLDEMKQEAIETLEAYNDNKDQYREPQQQELAAAINKGKEEINKAATIEDVEKALDDAQEVIDQIKTDEELKEEEQQALEQALNAVKEKALKELDAYNKKAGDYQREKDAFEAAIAEGKEAVRQATTQEGVEKALNDAKAKIDEIMSDKDYADQEEIEAAEDLADKKNLARGILEAYAADEEYQEPELTAFKKAREDGLAAIEAANTEKEVIDALEEAEDKIDRIKTIADYEAEAVEALNAAKEKAKQALETYKNDETYREAEQSDFDAAKEKGRKDIEEADTAEKVDQALAAAKEVIDKIKTDAQYKAEEEAEESLNSSKARAKAELDRYKETDYRPEERKELKEAISAGKEAIDQAVDQKGVVRALTAAQDRIKAIKTAAAYEAQEAAELAQAKKEAEDQLTSYKNKNDYRTEQQSELDQAQEAGLSAIRKASTKEEVKAALEAAKASMNQIKTNDQLTREEDLKKAQDAAKEAEKKAEEAKKASQEDQKYSSCSTLNEHQSAVKKVVGEKEFPGSDFSILKARQKKAAKKSISITWNKAADADGYIVYGTRCGSNRVFKKLAETKKRTFTQKNLKKGTNYKYLVSAYKLINGEKRILTSSRIIHIVTAGGKYGNHKAVKLKKKQLKIKTGKTSKIKATLVLQSGKKKVKKCRGIRYDSSNPKIATVSSKGNVKGIKKGVCYIYVLAQNGIYSKVTVTVK